VALLLLAHDVRVLGIVAESDHQTRIADAVARHPVEVVSTIGYALPNAEPAIRTQPAVVRASRYPRGSPFSIMKLTCVAARRGAPWLELRLPGKTCRC